MAEQLATLPELAALLNMSVHALRRQLATVWASGDRSIAYQTIDGVALYPVTAVRRAIEDAQRAATAATLAEIDVDASAAPILEAAAKSTARADASSRRREQRRDDGRNAKANRRADRELACARRAEFVQVNVGKGLALFLECHGREPSDAELASFVGESLATVVLYRAARRPHPSRVQPCPSTRPDRTGST